MHDADDGERADDANRKVVKHHLDYDARREVQPVHQFYLADGPVFPHVADHQRVVCAKRQRPDGIGKAATHVQCLTYESETQTHATMEAAPTSSLRRFS